MKLKRLWAFISEICNVDFIDIVMYIFIDRYWLSKHISAEGNMQNSSMFTARQRISKHSLTLDAVFFAWSVQSGYNEVFGSLEQYSIVQYSTVLESGQLSFESKTCL